MADRVVVIGGGISGLTLAHELAKRRVEHIVLEASDRVGGVMRSARVEGHLIEWGPQRARMTPDFAQLVGDLGLRDRVVEAPRDLPLFVYRAGRLRRVPFSASAFIGSDLLSWPAKLRLLAEPLTRAARDDESVGALFRRKLGREAYEALAGSLYGGLYASDPDDMIVGLSLGHTLRELGVGRSLLLPLLGRGGRAIAPAAVSFVDGLEELPRALYARHASRIRLERVRTLSRSPNGWTVFVGDDTIEASDVVITTSAHAAAKILRAELRDASDAIASLVYNPIAVVHLHAQTSMRGLGYQVALDESMVTRGVTFNDSMFGRSGVYTAFLGGSKHRHIAEAPSEEIGVIAREEFRRVTGSDARVVSVVKQWMPAWDRSWVAIQRLQLPAGLHVQASWHARPGIPGRLAGSRKLAEQLASRR